MYTYGKFNGKRVRLGLAIKDQGVLKTESDFTVSSKVNTKLSLLPQKGNLILNIIPLSLKSNEDPDNASFWIRNKFELKAKEVKRETFADVSKGNGELGEYCLDELNGVLYLNKEQNQYNITLDSNIFNSSNKATIMMSMKHRDQTTSGYAFILDNEDKLGVGRGSKSDTVSIKSSVLEASSATDVSVKDNEWFNVALVIDGTTLKLYHNGTLVSNQTLSSVVNNTNRIWLNTSATHRGSYSDIGIASLRVWKDTALTEEEVNAVLDSERLLNRGGN